MASLPYVVRESSISANDGGSQLQGWRGIEDWVTPVMSFQGKGSNGLILCSDFEQVLILQITSRSTGTQGI